MMKGVSGFILSNPWKGTQNGYQDEEVGNNTSNNDGTMLDGSKLDDVHDLED